MGMDTYSDICKNVVYIEKRSFVDSFDEMIESLDDDPEISNLAPIKGWKLQDDWAKAGLKQRLCAYLFTKGKKSVYIVNSSYYANVGGEYELYAFADSKSDVQAFLKDFGITSKITDIDSVTQTG